MTETPPDVLPPQWVDIDGTRVHFVHADGPATGPTFVLVHGLGGSLANWDSLTPYLQRHGQVYALDLAGFGRTRTEPGHATVRRNQQLLDTFLRRVVGRQVVLVGNSMGGLIVAAQAARSPGTVTGVVLVDPALPVSPAAPPHPLVTVAFGLYAVPPLGRRFLSGRAARGTLEQQVKDVFTLVTYDLSRVPRWLFDRHVEAARLSAEDPHSTEAFLVAARSILLALGRRTTYNRELGRILVPVLLIHGDRDRLVNVGTARSAAARFPAWTYAEGKDLGHCPMFEDPAWVADHLLAWLGSHPRIARKASAQGSDPVPPSSTSS
ncbi:alpha/beta hydrolase [Luteipulveratus sp. YIM 133132]|uniref:alpha/beta fold hydrolase n=1 Tax=Luteipulveratus flavus TaxID=3031728 RepID=UPI0023AF8582|nr:alpha/beta hydrolase [Luteipulveratus sp. YIM 133132]MDE9364849.1 alpha/beta hydrolase [Luteipulveratus sp. YIM 133132]